MFVNLTGSGVATLEDMDNFEAFKVLNKAAAEQRDQALAAIGRCEGEHVWVSTAWLRQNGRPDDRDWSAGFEKMLDYAKSAGWMDEQGGVRAHIENG